MIFEQNLGIVGCVRTKFVTHHYQGLSAVLSALTQRQYSTRSCPPVVYVQVGKPAHTTGCPTYLFSNSNRIPISYYKREDLSPLEWTLAISPELKLWAGFGQRNTLTVTKIWVTTSHTGSGRTSFINYIV